jgi:hypothetical protein
VPTTQSGAAAVSMVGTAQERLCPAYNCASTL